MKKTILIFLLSFASLSQLGAATTETVFPIIMVRKVENPAGGHSTPAKSPGAPLLAYQDGNTFSFGESLSGSTFSLLSNDVVVLTVQVDNIGTVTVPESFSGFFEIQIACNDTIFSAEIEL